MMLSSIFLVIFIGANNKYDNDIGIYNIIIINKDIYHIFISCSSVIFISIFSFFSIKLTLLLKNIEEILDIIK